MQLPPYEVDSLGRHIEFANTPPTVRRYRNLTDLDAWSKASNKLAAGVAPHDVRPSSTNLASREFIR